MSLSDPIGDMIARIKNAQMRNHKKVELPSSKSVISSIIIISSKNERHPPTKKEGKPLKDAHLILFYLCT